jgi:glyoxylase-like metal-dependent hydrolase (beta-lactamase superfamily II)
MPWLQRRFSAPIHLTAKVRDFLVGERAKAPRLRDLARIYPMLGEQPFSCLALFQWLATAGREGYGVTDRFRFSVPVDGFLEDGDKLPGAPEWEVILAPGHSACSACFWNRRNRTLISGDAVLTLRGRAWFTPDLVDEAAMDHTEDRLRALDVDHLLPGHGRPIHGENLMSTAWSWRSRLSSRSVRRRISSGRRRSGARSLTQDWAARPDADPSPLAALRSHRRSGSYASVARLASGSVSTPGRTTQSWVRLLAGCPQ